MSAKLNYRVDVVKAEASNKYSVPCGMNSIVALSSRPITRQTWSIPAGHVAIYSHWVGQSLTGEYKIDRIVHGSAATKRSDAACTTSTKAASY